VSKKKKQNNDKACIWSMEFFYCKYLKGTWKNKKCTYKSETEKCFFLKKNKS
jgi:hypothetical protein